MSFRGRQKESALLLGLLVHRVLLMSMAGTPLCKYKTHVVRMILTLAAVDFQGVRPDESRCDDANGCDNSMR
jgi:hypothetical protein